MRGDRSPGLAARALFVLACGIALAVPIARAEGQSIDGLNGKIADAKDEAAALNSQIEDDIVTFAEAKHEASVAAGREDELTTVLADGRERSADLADKLSQARADLEAAQERLTRAQDALAERLVAIYKSGEASGIDVLLNADGYEDLTTRADLLVRVQEADRALAERVRDLRAQIAGQVERVDKAKERSDALNEEVEAARDEIAAARAEAEAQAAAAREARATQAATLTELDSQMKNWSAQVEKLEQQQRTPATPAAAPTQDYPGFGPWSIPEAIVMCESGGNFSALNPSSGAGGAYQILPSTWKAYGGKGLPHQAPPAEQHRIAAMIWADSGPSAWVCAA